MLNNTEEALENSDEQDINKCRSIIDNGNNALSFIIKTLTTAYYIGVFCSSIIFIFYFIYIKYIPNVKTAFILDGLVFVFLLGLFSVLLFVAMGFPGIYYLPLNSDNNIKEKEKRAINNENSINASRKKFIPIIFISTFLYVLINLFLINLNNHSQLFFLFVALTLIVPIIFSIIVFSIISNKNLEEYDHKKYLILILILLIYLVIIYHNLTFSLGAFFISLIAITISTNIFRLKSFLPNLSINFVYFLTITILLAGLFSTILIFLNIKYTKFPTYNWYYLGSIYIVIPFIFAFFAAFFNIITFDITALIENRNNIYYLKKHAKDILIQLVVLLLLFFYFNLYTFPFNYFKLGSFEKNVIVNKYGYSILKTAGYPCKYIYSYTNTNTSACSKPDKCFKVKTFILSDIGSNIYLESKVYNKTQGKNKLLNSKYVHVLVPQKDFLFLSYKNKLAKNKKTNNICKKSKK